MKSSDTDLLSQVIEDQHNQIHCLKENLWKTQARFLFERVVTSITLLLLVSSFLIMVGYPVYKNFTTPTTVTDCQTDYDDVEGHLHFHLVGTIPWHHDRLYGAFPTLQEALEAKRLVGCPNQ